jgi:hypothetical protein
VLDVFPRPDDLAGSSTCFGDLDSANDTIDLQPPAEATLIR